MTQEWKPMEDELATILAEQKKKHEALVAENFKEEGKYYSILEAHNTVESLLAAIKEAQDIVACLQPLLHELSVVMYGDNSDPVDLGKMVADAVLYVQKTKGVQ